MVYFHGLQSFLPSSHPQGPPGTGKTTTIMALLSLLLRQSQGPPMTRNPFPPFVHDPKNGEGSKGWKSGKPPNSTQNCAQVERSAVHGIPRNYGPKKPSKRETFGLHKKYFAQYITIFLFRGIQKSARPPGFAVARSRGLPSLLEIAGQPKSTPKCAQDQTAHRYKSLP